MLCYCLAVLVTTLVLLLLINLDLNLDLDTRPGHSRLAIESRANYVIMLRYNFFILRGVRIGKLVD